MLPNSRSSGPDESSQCTHRRAARMLCTLLLLAGVLGVGCGESPEHNGRPSSASRLQPQEPPLPMDYGIYLGTSNAWTHLPAGNVRIEGDRFDLLIFDRRLATSSAGVNDLVSLVPLRRLERFVEQVVVSKDEPPVRYSSVATSLLVRIETDPAIPLSARPVSNRVDMLRVSPSTSMLNGAYGLMVLDSLHTLRVQDGKPEMEAVHRWYTTIDRGEGFSWSDWHDRTQGGGGTYGGLTIVREEYRPWTSYGDLIATLSHEIQQQASTSSVYSLAQLSTKVAALDDTLAEQARSALTEAALREIALAFSNDLPAAVLAIEELVKPHAITTASIAEAAAKARVLIEERERQNEAAVAALIEDSTNRSTQTLAQFQYRYPHKPGTNTLSITSSGITWDGPGYNNTYVWFGNMKGLVVYRNLRENLAAVETSLPDRGNHTTREFIFADDPTRSTFMRELNAAREAWERRHHERRVTRVTAHPHFWSEKVMTQNCRFSFDPIPGEPSGTYEVRTDRDRTYQVRTNSDVHIKGPVAWMQFRSQEPHPITILVERFPYDPIPSE